MQIRTIHNDDWQAIAVIQQQCYQAALVEHLSVLQNKWRLSPSSCFVAEENNQILGYCLAHPWDDNSPPSLNTDIKPLASYNTVYLHDMAIHPQARGKSIPSLFLSQLYLFANNNSLTSLTLIAVQGAKSYWETHGFTIKPIVKSLASYHDDAYYMTCPTPNNNKNRRHNGAPS